VLQHNRVFHAAVRALGERLADARSDRLFHDSATVAPADVETLRRAVATYAQSHRQRRPAVGPPEYASRAEPTPTTEALWRQLLANPGDITTRAVCRRHALLAIGDPARRAVRAAARDRWRRGNADASRPPRRAS
jgi:hypothetical protein